jgi:hypothetical protein
VIAAGGPTRPRERAAALPSSAYIAGRLSDNFWIIFCPVLALVSMQAVWKWSGLSDLAIFSILFGLVVTGLGPEPVPRADAAGFARRSGGS